MIQFDKVFSVIEIIMMNLTSAGYIILAFILKAEWSDPTVVISGLVGVSIFAFNIMRVVKLFREIKAKKNDRKEK